ncbi:hypothetical protein EBT31_00850 [bacterium]|nr:hypothetical protein [bacterium]NBX49064.1 hypothetical protein [bacterium]
MQFNSDGNPNVFNVERNDDGSWLNNNWAKPTNKWDANNEFVFRLRKCCIPRLHGAVFALRIFKILELIDIPWRFSLPFRQVTPAQHELSLE